MAPALRGAVVLLAASSWLLACCWFRNAESARVVGYPRPQGKSHYMNMIAVLKHLEGRGHETGIVTPNTDVAFISQRAGDLALGLVEERTMLSAEEMEELVARIEDMGFLETMALSLEMASKMEFCPARDAQDTAAKLKALDIDLLIIDGSHPCAFIVADLLDVPRATLYTFQPFLHLLEQQHGVHSTTALWPSVHAEYDPYLPTAAGRFRSAAIKCMFQLLYPFMNTDKIFRKVGLNSTIREAAARSRVALVASDPFLDLPVHLPAYVHQVGAITPKDSGPLPEEQDAVLRASRGQSVYMSFGTTGVGNKTAAAFTAVWEQMKEITVIWKVADVAAPTYEAARQLPNVHLMTWVDQNAMLAHKDLGVFLSHGGHNSVSEAAYHGVPTLAVPHMADQSDSSQRLVHHGSGIKINKKDLNADKIQASIRELLDNPAYKQEAVRLSKGLRLFRTRGQPLDRVADLLEDELMAMAEGMTTWPTPLPPMPWWQVHQLDIHFALAAICSAALFLVLSLLRMCCKRCCCRSRGGGHGAQSQEKLI